MEKAFFIASVLGGMITVALVGVQFIWKKSSGKTQENSALRTHPLDK